MQLQTRYLKEFENAKGGPDIKVLLSFYAEVSERELTLTIVAMKTDAPLLN